MADDNLQNELLLYGNISYLLPSHTEFDARKQFTEAIKSRRPLTTAIDQREFLFFDETLDVYIVLRAPFDRKNELQSQLKRLSISLEAQVVCSHVSTQDGDSPAEIIYHGEPDHIETPIIIAEEAEEEDQESEAEMDGKERSANNTSAQDGQSIPKRLVNFIWRLTAYLARPRHRLQSPSITFCLSAGLHRVAGPFRGQGGCLPSGEATGFNLLEAFGSDTALGIRPRLSALRVSRVVPLAREQDEVLPVSRQGNRALRIFPAMHTRVRFARPNMIPLSSALIAILEIDFTPYFNCEILLEKISLDMADGFVEDLNDSDMMGLPLSCVAHDHVSFYYKLTPANPGSSPSKPGGGLQVRIHATALVQPETCFPRLSMSWTTPLDFALPLNPSFGFATPAIQRSHRPGQLSISGGGDVSSMKSPSVSRPDAIPALEEAARSEAAAATAPSDSGVAVTLSGPVKPVYVGDEFTWKIFIMNHMVGNAGPNLAPGHQAPRKLAITPISARRRDTAITKPRSMSGPAARLKKGSMLADVAMGDNVMSAMQRESLADAADIVCLSADTRVGPLAPGACHAVELKFLALSDGIAGVEALRIIDLVSSEHVDVYDLPLTVVKKRS